jgi:hypothetical protein
VTGTRTSAVGREDVKISKNVSPPIKT